MTLPPACRIPAGDPRAAGFAWSAVPPLPLDRRQRLWPHFRRPAPPTVLRAVAAPAALWLRAECRPYRMALLAPPQPSAPIDQFDHVWLLLAPANDTLDWHTFRVDFRGQRDAKHETILNGEPLHGHYPDVWRLPATALRADQWEAWHGAERRLWWAELAIPWASLGLSAPPPTLGLAYGRAFATGIGYPALDHVLWPAREVLGQPDVCRIAGQAALGDAVLPTLCELRAGHPETRVTLACPAAAGGRATFTTPAGSASAPLGDAPVTLTAPLPLALLSPLHLADPPRGELAVHDAAGRLVYVRRLPLERHLGACADFQAAAPPAGCSREAWLTRLALRLPPIRRRSTRDGAPSDFTLQLGESTVDLMAAGAWPALAALVRRQGATLAEQLLTALVLVAHKAVTNLVLEPNFFTARGEQNYHSPAHLLHGPLSVLRFGGGPALARAAVLARLLQELTDPATGQPLRTRVIALAEQGGPRQAGRCYRACKALAPFGQEPGRLGAVAVEYRDDVTLLDPTALVCFPRPDGTLATLAEIAAEPALLADGAGALADAYRQLDREELLRQPVNRLLSRGVFPELAASEDSPDQPFALPQPYRPPVLRLGDGPVCLSLDRERDGRPSPRRAQLTVTLTSDALLIAAEITGPGAAATDRDRAAEALHLLLDPEHGHHRYLHLTVPLVGAPTAVWEEQHAMQTLFKHLSTESAGELAPAAPGTWQATATATPAGWRVAARLPRPDGPVAGCNAWLGVRHPHYHQLFLTPPRYLSSADPYTFADLYLAPAPVTVAELDLGVPVWGAQEARVTLANHTAAAQVVTLASATHLHMQREELPQPPVTVTVPPQGRATAAVPCWIDPREKMGTGGGQVVELTASLGPAPCFRASLQQAYHTSPGVYFAYGDRLPATPPEGVAERRLWQVARQLPELRRQTTRDGAPSDFTIVAADGTVFDLMRPDALRRLGRWLDGRFPDPVERILAAFLVKMHPEFFRHLSTGHRYNAGCGPLPLLRLGHAGGGGNCGFNSRVLCGLLNELRLPGPPLAAHTQPVWGHVISAFTWRGASVLMDGDVGHLFLTPDGRDFATIDDLRQGRYATTAGPGDMGRYLTFDAAVARHCPPVVPRRFPARFPAW